jgi:hypothetical protein
VFENRVLKIFEPTKGELQEAVENYFKKSFTVTLTNTVRMTKSRKIRWEGRYARRSSTT